jgi:pimeloyl-ACP methyl ester carboxylesterase
MTTPRSWTCVFLLMFAAFGQRANPAGEWQAAVGKQHLNLKVEQAAGGTFSGTVVAVDQGNAVIPIDAFSFRSDGSVRFEMKSIPASFEGRLAADGASIPGEWKQGGASVPLVFRRPGASAAAFTLKPATKGRVHLEPCRAANDAIEALCGSYEVFENRQTHAGRRIALNLMIIPAKADAPDPDPLFALAGGPGQSATEAFPLAAYVRAISDRRDVVLVDQRGTGKSNLLDCALLSLDKPQEVLGEPYSLERIRACRADSDRKADTTQYTTSIAADDLDEVREALGYDRINVLGGSYGTKAALVYLRRHGEHVRTLTLEAIAPPDFLIPLPFAKGVQAAVEGVIALCEADGACRAAYPELRQQYRAIVARLAGTAAEFDVRNQHVTLSKEMFVSKLRSVLYVPQFVSVFPLIVQRAYAGDWSAYAAVVMQLATLLDGAVARGASFAAICAEDVPAITPALVRSATAGTDLGDSQARRYEEYCKAWGTAGSVPKDYYEPVRSKVPALLISGALDPGTPPAFAQAAAKVLPNGRLVTIKEGTHGTGSTCVDGLIAEFVKRGSAKDLDASCVAGIHLPPFVTR